MSRRMMKLSILYTLTERSLPRGPSNSYVAPHGYFMRTRRSWPFGPLLVLMTPSYRCTSDSWFCMQMRKSAFYSSFHPCTIALTSSRVSSKSREHLGARGMRPRGPPPLQPHIRFGFAILPISAAHPEDRAATNGPRTPPRGCCAGDAGTVEMIFNKSLLHVQSLPCGYF